jgi:hypothetical protein
MRAWVVQLDSEACKALGVPRGSSHPLQARQQAVQGIHLPLLALRGDAKLGADLGGGRESKRMGGGDM